MGIGVVVVVVLACVFVCMGAAGVVILAFVWGRYWCVGVGLVVGVIVVFFVVVKCCCGCFLSVSPSVLLLLLRWGGGVYSLSCIAVVV